jgi:hypothetical protein
MRGKALDSDSGPSSRPNSAQIAGQGQVLSFSAPVSSWVSLSLLAQDRKRVLFPLLGLSRPGRGEASLPGRAWGREWGNGSLLFQPPASVLSSIPSRPRGRFLFSPY